MIPFNKLVECHCQQKLLVYRFISRWFKNMFINISVTRMTIVLFEIKQANHLILQ